MLALENKFNPSINVMEKEAKKGEEFNPYVNNEGTVMSLSGDDYIIVAGDKRISDGYSIVSRNVSKLCKLTDKCILASSGMYADIVALQKYLKARIEIYRSSNRQEPSLESIAQMLSVTLYSKRFFPYYAFNILSGQTEDGSFISYGYDAIGSYEKFKFGSTGSGGKLITPVLDKIGGTRKMNEAEAKNLVLETMNGCSCRDIYTGDKVELMIIRKNGDFINEEYALRND